ncbi:putative Repressor of RNA polymerase III transcription MAF1-like protein [Hypsibius exemplaris]|uniref:Repressor of RNA polymerase III transcription MAF1 n=1 Tax=Hypsibius exemplaris TaxID=2072580 RepID=A0A1W0WZ94_HYPEX|nr:putative Repressor of RNA polymerase III transcription MAF1-like protein [Hypsibius exemplaris]
MKLIENVKFEAITSDLAAMENEYRLDARLEIYSCKAGTSDERKKEKSFKSSSSSSAPDKTTEWLGPPDSLLQHGTSPGAAAVGSQPDSGTQLCDTINKKTFWYLVATLNASYGMDGDFSDVQSQMFSREPSVQWVIDRINVNFTTVLGADFDRFKSYIWKTIDDSICLRDCVVYSFSPDPTYDPYASEHHLWKFWYLFYNAQLKRVCFFQCRAVKSGTDSSEWDEEEDLSMEEDAGYYSRTISTA